MDLSRFQSITRAHLAERAAELGLDAARLQVEYVLNWGGFVNRSFRVTDGRTVLHLKLAHEPEIRDALRRYWALRPRLSERYHAPEPVAWVEVPATEYVGVLSRWVDGAVPASLDMRMAEEVVAAMTQLHGDRELAAHLPAPAAPLTCADTYLRTYSERFHADLAFVEEENPPFVPASVREWMRREAEWIDAAVAASPAFREPADTPMHGDLWLNNLLVTPGGEWFVLDWDNLELGDPAIDWAMLFGPSIAELRDAMDRPLPAAVTVGAAVRERLALYARASLLDWIIDPLADWIDAGEAPEHVAQVRPEKERIHRAALAAYRQRYG
ncbi:MAG TPA: aminoglycoside phosphotransferase family protein [Longimicrobium sp.]|nr:aminoglycoside phosphotransferase family protein [Longimicrobium sp.]